MDKKFSLVPLVESWPLERFRSIISLAIEVLSLLQTKVRGSEQKLSLIKDKMAERDLYFIKGGQSLAFAIKVTAKINSSNNLPDLIVKVYTKFKPIQLIYHVITSAHFSKIFINGINIDDKRYFVSPAKNILLSKPEQHDAAFLVQNFSIGKEITHQGLPISSLAKEIAKKGFIIDPWINNWRLLQKMPNIVHLEYIDTLLSNRTNFYKKQLIKKVLTALNDYSYTSI